MLHSFVFDWEKVCRASRGCARGMCSRLRCATAIKSGAPKVRSDAMEAKLGIRPSSPSRWWLTSCSSSGPSRFAPWENRYVGVSFLLASASVAASASASASPILFLVFWFGLMWLAMHRFPMAPQRGKQILLPMNWLLPEWLVYEVRELAEFLRWFCYHSIGADKSFLNQPSDRVVAVSRNDSLNSVDKWPRVNCTCV